MGLRNLFKRKSLARWLRRIFKRSHAKIGIYGPPNSGKTTLANRIGLDWSGKELGVVSDVPHETRRANKKENIIIQNGRGRLQLDIVDTPGIATKVDYKEFMKYGLSKGDARKRAKEATEGVIESIRWLNDIDGVLLVMDACKDPYTQINITILGNLEARSLPVLLIANKIDLPNSSPNTIINAFPQHKVVPISALQGEHIEDLYRGIVECFG